jgi:hypothetical protein
VSFGDQVKQQQQSSVMLSIAINQVRANGQTAVALYVYAVPFGAMVPAC